MAKTVFVTFRVSPEDDKFITDAAEEKGLTKSAFILRAVKKCEQFEDAKITLDRQKRDLKRPVDRARLLQIISDLQELLLNSDPAPVETQPSSLNTRDCARRNAEGRCIPGGRNGSDPPR